MGLKGAILGDIAGSLAEFEEGQHEWRKTNFFEPNSVFTDDTVESIAIKEAFLTGRSYKELLVEWGKRYIFVGYGGSFHKFLNDPQNAPNNSYGDGAVMRVSYLGTCFDTIEETEREAELSAIFTHNSTEAICGAKTVAGCIFLAEHNYTKNEILKYAANRYPLNKYKYSVLRPLADYRNEYKFEVRCDNTVPVAIRCFYESKNYLNFLQNVHYIGGDTDTLGAIGGGIAESFYKETGFNEDKLLRYYLDDTMLKWVLN